MEKLLLKPKVLEKARKAGGPAQMLSMSPLPLSVREKPASSTVAVDEGSANEIKEMLQLCSLRNWSPAEASKILFGDNVTDIQVCFEYSEVPKKEVVAKDFKQSLHHLNFSPILQYVAIPNVTVNLDKSEAEAIAGPGRRDAPFFIHWLRERGVDRILRVIVDDIKTPAHDDETIENVLQDLGVEVLDWQKLDLCPTTIGSIGSQLEQVHLYWSGNNTVLRGWSEPEGLVAIEKLKAVHLHPRLGDVQTNRQSENIQKFIRRLQSYPRAHKIEVDVTGDGRYAKLGQPLAPMPPGPKPADEPQKWMETMKRFAEVIYNLKHPDKNDKRLPPQLKEEIKIAIIDDGADISQIQLRSNIAGGRTLYQEEDREHPYYFSSSGHGTAMASLVQQVFPHVKLYIFRLESHSSEGGKVNFKAETVVEAIKLAVDHQVHIISMSWTILASEQDDGVRKSLEQAVSQAFDHQILMFCSADDAGETQKETYPSFHSRDKVLRIGAADAAERSDKWVAECDFLLPGVNVKHNIDASLEMKDSEFFLDGSSIATALAAGLAGLILYCVQLAAVYTIYTHINEEEPTPATSLTENEYEKLKTTREVMKNAFENIGLNKQRFVEIWQQFDPATRNIENSHFLMDKLSAVAEMARNLIKKH